MEDACYPSLAAEQDCVFWLWWTSEKRGRCPDGAETTHDGVVYASSCRESVAVLRRGAVGEHESLPGLVSLQPKY